MSVRLSSPGGISETAGDARYLKLDASNDPITEDLAISKNLYLGTDGTDTFIYFAEDGSPTGESLSWNNAGDKFLFSDTLEVGGSITTSGTIYAGTSIYSDGDIYTTGAGDDLWLGNSTQANAPFQAYAAGEVRINADSQKLLFGEDQDASIYYDGTDMWVNPKEDGSGVLGLADDTKLSFGTGKDISLEFTTTGDDRLKMLGIDGGAGLIGAGVDMESGAGGAKIGADDAATGGDGGDFKFTGGEGGYGLTTGTGLATGGDAGVYSFTGGAGGAAYSGGVGDAVAGKGTNLTFNAGSGGIAIRAGGSGATTGGDGGDVQFNAGNGGSGDTSGTVGSIFFGSYLELKTTDLYNNLDNFKYYRGGGDDVSDYFDGADWIFNSENVQANDEVHFTNFDKYTFDNDLDTASTIRTASDDDWDLNDYTAGTVVDTGYVDVTINGTAYKLLARLEP